MSRKATKPTETVVTGQTKMDMCRELFKENSGLARKEYVQLFVEKAGLTVPGAKTYAQIILSNAKKAAGK